MVKLDEKEFNMKSKNMFVNFLSNQKICNFFYSQLDTTRCHGTPSTDQPVPCPGSAQSPGYEQVGKAYQGRDGYEREIPSSAWVNIIVGRKENIRHRVRWRMFFKITNKNMRFCLK